MGGTVSAHLFGSGLTPIRCLCRVVLANGRLRSLKVSYAVARP